MRTGPRRHDSQCLWDLDWLHLPSSTVAPPSSSSTASASAASTAPTFAQWHRRLGHLSGSRLSTLVGSGVLGPISGDAALHCTGCKLGKQLQLPFPLLILFHGALLISFTLMYGGLLPPL